MIIKNLRDRFITIDKDFYWFMQVGKIPCSYGYEPAYLSTSIEDDTLPDEWYDFSFDMFFRYDEIILEEMVDAL